MEMLKLDVHLYKYFELRLCGSGYVDFTSMDVKEPSIRYQLPFRVSPFV